MRQKSSFNCIFPCHLKKNRHKIIKIFLKTKFISIIFCYICTMNITNMEVKKLNRLKVVMAEKDLSNIWLSEKLGVSQATVSKWMTNFSQPNIETLIKISKVLNVEVSELLRTDEVQIED